MKRVTCLSHSGQCRMNINNNSHIDRALSWTRAILPHAIFQQPYEEGANSIPKLQTRKRRHREVVGLAQGHTTERQSLDLNLQESDARNASSDHPTMTPQYPHLYVMLPPQHAHWRRVMNFAFTFFCARPYGIHLFPSLSEHFTFPLQVIFFIRSVCLTSISWLPPGHNSWLVSTVAVSKALVALVCCPAFLISHPALLYSVGKKVKKYFQGLTGKGSQKLSTNTFILPMKTQVYRAKV